MSIVVRSLRNDRKSCMFRSEVGPYSSCRQWRVWEIVVSHKLVSSWKPVVYHKPEPTMISQSSQTKYDVHYIPSKAFRYISFSLQSSYDDVIILLKASLTLVVRMLNRVHFFYIWFWECGLIVWCSPYRPTLFHGGKTSFYKLCWSR